MGQNRRPATVKSRSVDCGRNGCCGGGSQIADSARVCSTARGEPHWATSRWVEPPARLDNFYGTRVCAVDADGNEVAGIRLPPVAVPLGTYTGWNVYRAQPCELCDRDGSLIPFARTRSEREGTGDPRLSLEERYRTRDIYVGWVEAAAAALVADRLLLQADADAYVKAARERDRF